MDAVAGLGITDVSFIITRVVNGIPDSDGAVILLQYAVVGTSETSFRLLFPGFI